MAVQTFARTGSQLVHAAPDAPHAPGVGDDTHTFPLQQPLGHEVASHLHWLSTHRWPAAHADAVVPH